MAPHGLPRGLLLAAGALSGVLCMACATDGEAELFRLSLDTYPEARCLDGSPGAYYLRRATEAESENKWVVFFEGMSVCLSDTDCLKRSKGTSGSSKTYPEAVVYDKPYLSHLKDVNPLLHSWNIAFLKTCDGGYFAGTRGPVTLKAHTIYYSGKAILLAIFSELNAKGLDKATEVVIGGNSAGGTTALTQLNTIRSWLPAGAQVRGLADAGFYLATDQYVGQKRFTIVRQGAGDMLPSQCLEDNKEAPWRCYVASVTMRYLQVPVFLWASRYDTFQRSSSLDILCQSSFLCIEDNSRRMTKQLKQLLTLVPGSAIFVDACSHHCWSLTDPREMPRVDGMTAQQAFAIWYGGGRNEWHQEGTFPCFQCCPKAKPIFG